MLKLDSRSYIHFPGKINISEGLTKLLEIIPTKGQIVLVTKTRLEKSFFLKNYQLTLLQTANLSQSLIEILADSLTKSEDHLLILETALNLGEFQIPKKFGKTLKVLAVGTDFKTGKEIAGTLKFLSDESINALDIINTSFQIELPGLTTQTDLPDLVALKDYLYKIGYSLSLGKPTLSYNIHPIRLAIESHLQNSHSLMEEFEKLQLSLGQFQGDSIQLTKFLFKVKWLVEFINLNPGDYLVWLNQKEEALEYLTRSLKLAGVTTLLLTGESSPQERVDKIKEFETNQSQGKVLITNLYVYHKLPPLNFLILLDQGIPDRVFNSYIQEIPNLQINVLSLILVDSDSKERYSSEDLAYLKFIADLKLRDSILEVLKAKILKL